MYKEPLGRSLPTRALVVLSMQTDELRDYLNSNWRALRSDILNGVYRPSSVRKVEIPRTGGGVRMLGIPTVIDRLIQRSISQWPSPKYEGNFSSNSYGFRPNRNAHQAVLRAQEYLNGGYTWTVELDLDKFFDRVNHDKLMNLLSMRISDKRTLKLIRLYLSSGIMENGLVAPRREGTPQGSPLSPLLSNIVLHELDVKLEERGHRFVRYADDCSIYVRGRKSADRVMDNITSYLEAGLKLKVNREKSRVSRPSRSTPLGFSFYKTGKDWKMGIATKSVKSMKQKLIGHTGRNDPITITERIRKLDMAIRGWVNYFSIAGAKHVMTILDETTRVRLRMIIWKQWKNVGCRIRNLIKLGVQKQKAFEWSNSRKSYCRLSRSPILQGILSIDYSAKLKYTGFVNYYYWKTEHQTKLF